MTKRTKFRFAIVLLSAIAVIGAKFGHIKNAEYFFKALTMTIIVASTIYIGPRSKYKTLILMGLLFSFTGDIFLMVRGNYFIYGLFSSLITHIFYLWAFHQNVKFNFFNPMMVLYLGYGLLFIILISTDIRKISAPVTFYSLVIILMGWFAYLRFVTLRTKSAKYALIGSILFLVADTFLAYNKFHSKIPFSPIFILLPYYMAQFFIASSVDTQSDSNILKA